MFCPACNARHPPTASFCMHRGIPLRGSTAALREGEADPESAPRAQWEYQDLEIGLKFNSKGLSDEEVVQRYGQLVVARLASVGAAGWLQTLWDGGRIKRQAVGSFNPACAFDAVSIRVKRPLF